MDLDLLNHRDYQLGGLTVTLIVLFVSLGLNFTTVLILTPLAFSAGYVFWRCKSSRSTYSGTSAGYGRSSDVNSIGNRSYETTKQAGNKQRWTVTIGEEHTPSYIASPTENMDRSGLRGSLLSASIMSPATRSGRSLLGSPVAVSPARQGLSAGPGSTGMPLPRMRRVHDSYNEGSSLLDSPRRGLLSPGLGHTPPSSRRYPTHQPKYAGLGLMPPVHLQGPDRRVLSERNTSMLTSPVTVKIAPPDILKPPIPSIVPVEESLDAVNASHLNPCDAQNVLSAIREKRKRTMKDEEVTTVIDSRENKRRRHVHEADPRNPVAGEDPAESEEVAAVQEEEVAAEAGETATMETTLSRERSLKRPAISRSRAASIAEMEEQMVKRSRSSGPAFSSPTTPGSGSASHGRNPIEVSYSSSKRWLKKQQELGKSEERSAKRRLMQSESWARSARTHDTSSDSVSDSLAVRQSQVSTCRLSPRRILSLVDQDMPMRDDTESHLTPASEPLAAAGRVKLDSDDVGADVVQTPDVDDVRAKLFPVPRDSSSRRRHTQIRSDSNTEAFAKVPTLRYSLTTEDYEKDRVSEMKRVQQMLDDVEEAHAAKTASKTESKPLDAKDKKTATVSLATSSGLLSSTATKIPPLSTPASFASTSLLGMGTSTSTVLSNDTPKLLSAPSSFTLGGLTSSSNSTVSSAASSHSAMSTQSLSAVTSVTSISTPLLQTGAALSTVSSKDLPATTSVVTALQFTTQATTETPQLPTGGGGPHRLATSTSQASATAESKLAATGVVTSSACASTDKSATTSSSSSYTFPPLFPGTASSAGDATATSSGRPPPSYNSIERSTTGGFNFDGAAAKAVPAASSSVSSTVDTTTLTAAPFTFSVASTTLTSATNSTTTSSMPGFSFTSTAPAAFGATNASAVHSGPTAPTSLSSSFSFGSVLPVSSSQAATSHFNVPSQTSSSDFGSTLTSGSASTVSVSSVTGFGTTASSTVPAFSSNINATARMPFGASAPAIPAPVIATPATSTAFSFGGAAGQTGKIPSPFGEQASTMFGQAGASNTITAAPSVNIFPQQAEAPSIAFGQAPLNTAAPGGKDLFARAPAKTAGSAPSLFGSAAKPANGQAQNSGFQFGVATPNKTSSSTRSFQFGTSAANTSAPTTVQASPFAFGAQAPGDTNNKPGIMAFGQPTASATPAFGNTTAAPSNVFGSSGPSAPFGRSNASVTFGTATTTNNMSPAFGQPVVQGTQNAFGVDANKGGCAFGSTGPMSQPAFGVSTTNAFGGGQQQSSSGGFGAPAKTQAAKGFDFSASAKPVLNFGGAPSAAQTPPQQAGFTFGAANTQQNTGFNFNAGGGGGGGFGMTAPCTPQMGSQPPAFGTPGANPAGPPNLFSPPGTPGQGAFTIGSGNVQPRPRTVVRAARRRATKR